MIDELHSRQIRLREVRQGGQQRIAASTVTLGTDEASHVAAEYLRRSGVGRVRLEDTAVPGDFTHARHFTHEVSREFAHGCWMATTTLVEILGLTSTRDRKP